MDDSFRRPRFFRGRNISTSGRVAFHAPATIVHGVNSSRETSDAHSGLRWSAFFRIWLFSREMGSQWAHLQCILAFCFVGARITLCYLHHWPSWQWFCSRWRSQGKSHCKLPAWSFMFYLFLHGFPQNLWLLPPTVQTHTGQQRTLNSKVGVSANGCLSVLVSLRQRGLGSSNPVTLS